MLLFLSCLAFISLGLPDGLLGVAWPSMRAYFGRDLDALGLLLAVATAGYVASSASSGRLLRHLNLATVLALSCLTTAVALLAYALTPVWIVAVLFAAVLGAGGGAIDAALNTYAARNHGPRVLNWLHACFGFGAASGPVIMTSVLSAGLPWQRGYAIVGFAQLALAAAFAATTSRWPRAGHAGGEAGAEEPATLPATLRLAAARLGIVTFFIYSGVEASFGAWTYTLLTVAREVPPLQAGAAVSAFWGGLAAGRLAAAFGGNVSVRLLLTGSVACVVLGAVLVWLDAGPPVSIAGVLLAGFGSGPIFPSLVAVTPARLGAAHAANGVGFQIAAASLGIAVLPSIVGIVADTFGIELIATLLLAFAILLGLACLLLELVAPIRTVPRMP